MLKGKHLISLLDLSREQLGEILTLATRLKTQLKNKQPHPSLGGKTLAMIFEKPSTRTRVSFEVGMFQLGGQAINLRPGDIQMDGRESVADIARTLSRMVDGIMLRTFSHQTIVRLAQAATVPVINGLSDFEHPCQALADLLTLQEHFPAYPKVKMGYVGDGNNVAHSLIFAAALSGIELVVCTPKGYEPDATVMKIVHERFKNSKITVGNNPSELLLGCNVLYTDVWTSMGQEAETEKRLKDFVGYQINRDLLAVAASDCKVMHCLPAHRGEEISEEILEGGRSVVFDQAENRLHVQKAVMSLLMA